jgi:myo-inositol-1(or 4)-monophosphatase
MAAVRSATVNVMALAVKKAARGLIRDFNEVEHLQVSRKGPADFVSNADHKSERILREELGKARPDFGFRMEESAPVAAKDGTHIWVVDPLDGTTNFLHGLPHFAISIGLEANGEPIAGMVYDPIKDETFWAEKGQGAFLNDRRLRVSARRNLDESLIATGIPFRGTKGHARFAAEAAMLMPEVAGIRRFGAASLDLAYVAAGRYDGFWEWGLQSWDICAGIILVREAGGVVSEPGGGGNGYKTGNVLAANVDLHQPLSMLLKKAKPAAA